MNIVRKKEALILLVGDIAVLFLALYLSVVLRYGALPTSQLLKNHLFPFSILFIISVLLNFIAGLYENHTVAFKKKLLAILIKVQLVNTTISIAFFYLIPYLNIAPKITLFIYLTTSLIIMIAWRMGITETFGMRRKFKAVFIAHGPEAHELYDEVNQNQRYGTAVTEWLDTSSTALKSENVLDLVATKGISVVVADFNNQKVRELMPTLYNLIFSKVQFADIQAMYEEVFDRVPLSLVNDTWFLENVRSSVMTSFDLFKRFMDIVVSIVLGIISLFFYPFVYLAIKLDDRGVIFSYQDRTGQNNKIIRIVKFRTMSIANDGGTWGHQKNTITRVGIFLRKTRIDELPQLWNVFRGDVSLVGPRPEFPDAVSQYSKQIPYYNVRHIVKPGLSGWAQIYGMHPHHGINMEETANKLSYDLYYIKNRSIFLDLKIALQTIKVFLSFVGR